MMLLEKGDICKDNTRFFLILNFFFKKKRYATFEKYDEQIKNTLGYDEYTKGWEYFGFNVQKNGSVMYREWAPNAVTASLVGDFSKFLSKKCWGVVEERE